MPDKDFPQLTPPLTRRNFLGGNGVAGAAISAAAFTTTGFASPVSSNGARKTNFVYILSDDHAAYALGCDGDRRALTPNLDKLAGQSTRFARHFCNSPVCTPSRQSLLTGQMPSHAGVTVLRTSLDPAKPTLAKQFQKAGYQTAVFGKMHWNRASAPGLYGFDEAMTEQDIQRAWAAQPAQPAPDQGPTKPRWQPFKDPARIWLNSDQLPFPRRYEEMRGTFTARQAIGYLERASRAKEPFALWVSFPEPHSPFDFPYEMRKLHDRQQFPAPAVGPEDAWQIPLIFRQLSADDKAGIIASYYTAVHQLDRNIGEVLTALERLGLAENTCVVYLADHGYCLGHHGRFEKHCGYDPALRVPLLVRQPGKVKAGHVVHQFTEHIDVPATITDLLNLEPLPVQHGQSLRPYLEGRKAPRPRRHVFSQYLENEEVYLRDQRWKYIYGSGKRARTDGYETDNPKPGRYERLFDLRQDPGEFRNVAAQHPEVVRKMRQAVVDRFAATHPEAAQCPKADAPEVLDWYVRPRDA